MVTLHALAAVLAIASVPYADFTVVQDGQAVAAPRVTAVRESDGILTDVRVSNASEKSVDVRLDLDGHLIGCFDGAGRVADDETPIPAKSSRVYKYRYWEIKPQDPNRVAEIRTLLRPESGFAETRITNRDFWERVGQARGGDFLRRAVQSIETPPPDVDDRYYTFEAQHRHPHPDQVNWNVNMSKRFRRLSLLTYAEAVENRGRFLKEIEKELYYLSAKRVWVNPYHDREYVSFLQNDPGQIELGSAAFSMRMAMALDILRPVLPTDVRTRALAALYRHTFDTYLKGAKNLSLFARKRCLFATNYYNWNAACNSHMLGAILSAVDDPTLRAEAIEFAERSLGRYEAGFTQDGLCEEGISYWDYGFGRYLRAGLWIRRATDGKLPFFTERSRQMMTSVFGTCYKRDLAPQFGDTSKVGGAKSCHLGALVWPEYTSDFAGSVAWPDDGLEDLGLRLSAGDTAEKSSQPRPAYPFALRDWYGAELQQLVCRPAAGDAAPNRLYAAFKGGYNNVNHGHHDVGSYCIAPDGIEVMGDPGNRRYELTTFGPKRYECDLRNSFGHPVPYPDRTRQRHGYAARAVLIDKSFSDEADVVTLDLRHAYPCQKLKTLTRTFRYLRKANEVEVTDRVAYDGKGAFETALVSFGSVTEIGEGTYLFTSKDGQKKAKCEIRVTGAPWKLVESELPSTLNPQRGTPRRYAVALEGDVSEAEVTVRWSTVRDGRRTVTLKPGDNYIDTTVVITDAVRYASSPKARSRIVGAHVLKGAAFEKVTDPSVLSRLPEEGCGKVYVCDFKSRVDDPLVFIGGEIGELARWPNAGEWAYISKEDIVCHGVQQGGRKIFSSCAFVLSDPRAKRWDFSSGVRLKGYWTHDWSFAETKVASFGPVNGTNDVVTFAGTIPYGLMKWTNGGHAKRRYYAFDLLEELDAAGEYYYDRKNGKLYVAAPEGVERLGEIAVCDSPGPLFRVANASDVAFVGVEFAYRNEGFLEIANARDLMVEDCAFTGCGATPAISATGAERCTIRNSTLSVLGAGGIKIDGGDRTTLRRGENLVENCKVLHFGKIRRAYASAVALAGVGNTMRGCELAYAPHMAVSLGCTYGLFESNDVHHVLLETGDCGAFYGGRNWYAAQGLVIRHNHIHDLGKLGHSCVAIYFDDGQCGGEVYGNVIENVTRGMLIGGGRDHIVHDNVFRNCSAVGVSIDFRGLVWRQFTDGEFNLAENAMKAVRFTESPWKEAFPRMAHYLDVPEEKYAPLGNEIYDNLFIDCPKDKKVIALSTTPKSAPRVNPLIPRLRLENNYSVSTGAARAGGPDERAPNSVVVLDEKVTWPLAPDSPIFGRLPNLLKLLKQGKE